MSENNIAILFTISNFSVAVKPLFNNRFTVEEIYRLLQANDDEDLDRIEVYGGALYCFEEHTKHVLNNMASEFWFENAPHMDRDGIVGNALFIPTKQDLYIP
jgi:hypothetical protein